MPRNEFAVRLLEMAAKDEYMVDLAIPDTSAPDEAIGFHCQQAVEKLLKGVLVQKGIRFEKYHDLNYLMDLINDAGDPLPPRLMDVDTLNPFAVTFRYEALEAITSFNREYSRELVRQLREWVEERVYCV